MRLFIAVLLSSCVAALPAAAQDAPAKPFEGASVTAIAGVDDSSWIGRANAGVLYGGQAGYDLQSGKTVFGLEAEVTGVAGHRRCVPVANPSGGAGRDCLKAGRDLYIGGRIGAVIGDSTLLFAKAGYTNALTSYDYRVGGVGSARFVGSGAIDGVRVGAGIEHRLASAVTLKAEYRYSNYSAGYSRHQGVIGLGFRF